MTTIPTRKSKLLRVFWMAAFLLIAMGCLLHWPLNENQHVLARGARMAYWASVRIVRSTATNNVMHFYGKAASLRLTMPHGSSVVASAVPGCKQVRIDKNEKLFDSTATAAAGNMPLAPACQTLPGIPEVSNVAVKRTKLQLPLVAHKVVAPVIPKLPTAAAPAAVTVVKPQGPVPLVSLRDRATCNQGVSLNIVAHEDDDLLFMNPDIQKDITAGICMRTVYVTAGDAGQPAAYWSGREQGAKAAYASMYHVDDSWRDEQQLIDGKLTEVSYLQDVPQVSLVFLRLPDGNMFGEGFAGNNNESLDKLLAGQVESVHAVSDDKSAYSKDDIVAALQAVMQVDTPQIVRTQNPQGKTDGDHADHAAVATLAGLAADSYAAVHTLLQYAGYPDKTFETNLDPEQIASKQAVFFAYASHDAAVCQTANTCAETATYGNYLERQYQISQVVSGQ